MPLPAKDQYNTFAPQYDALPNLPVGKLEEELILTALGNCKDTRILDLGGGNGLHAREALAAGADTIDVVDISQEMLNIGITLEKTQSTRTSRINYYHGDASQPLTHLPLPKSSYDIVMANWVFDHSTTPSDLDGMMSNVATYLRPGGKLISMRVANARTTSLASGKYGVVYENVRSIPHGVSYTVAVQSEPPLRFEGTSMEASYSGSTEIYERHGLTGVRHTFGEGTRVVERDPAFWAEWLRDPYAALTTAVKV